jgi:DNA-binding transcriptional ArsR family regulator
VDPPADRSAAPGKDSTTDPTEDSAENPAESPDAALKALAEPNRRAILRLVSGGPRSVGEIAGHLDITAQAVSRHLRVLRDACLVDEHRQGTRHLFVVRPDGFSAVQDFLADFWTRQLGQLKDAVENPSQQQPGEHRQHG